MRVNNPLYKNIGIHVICSLFTVDKGTVKVLLIKRKEEPFKDKWALIGGALYNNETLEDGIKREIYEKTGLKNINLYLSNIESEIDRSPLKRMIAINYIGVIDKNNAILKDTEKTKNADWFTIDNIPSPLAYDHTKILTIARNNLKELVVSTDVLKSLFKTEFTLPELQKTYESILEEKLDRRNFRKKLISLNIIEETNKTELFAGKKPAKLYKFKPTSNIKNLF